jgi:uridine kinase
LRNRVAALPQVLQALRAGESVRAPGYDAATRGQAAEVHYDTAGQSVILIDGGFAGHASLRGLLDLVVFVVVPGELQRERFQAFYGWKKLDQAAIEALWCQRVEDEWPAIDAQRASADLVIEPKGSG